MQKMSNNHFIVNGNNSEIYAQMQGNAINVEINNNVNINNNRLDYINSGDNYYYIYYNNNYYDMNINVIYNIINHDNNEHNNHNNDIEQPQRNLFTKDVNCIGETCIICLESIEDLESMALTNCNGTHHTYHETCINQWLITSSSCPYCRTSL